tara:strand:+ start:37100 stop:43060 length:5961 start_codon:yes stop_codon:yes gene_type:complete
MAKCFNRNTPEYKELLNKYESPMVVDTLINGWQVVTKSNNIPTLFDVGQFISNQKVFYNLERKNVAESILFNLGPKGEKKLISKWNGEFYINNTNKEFKNTKGDPVTLERNRIKVQRILDYWQINPEAVSIEKTERSYRIKILHNNLNLTDSILESKDVTHANDIIEHLTRLFPDLDVKIMDEKEARKLYNNLPQFKEYDGRQFQKKQDFNDVKSFYVDGTAVLIKGRINSETAIEEILHPFINALYTDKSSLFNSLVRESRSTFPRLYQEIQGTYTDTKGFNKEMRDKELVTQALSRHFKKEYEEVPTVSFRSKIKEFMKWLMDIFKDLSKYVVGKDLILAPGMLDSNLTLSDLAKVLNTGDLQFNVERAIRDDRNIYFKLSKEKKKILDSIVPATPQQKHVIDDLFNNALNLSEKNIDDFTVSMSGKSNHPLVILRQEDHVYLNVEDNLNPIPSTTTKISGVMAMSYKIKPKDTIQSIAKEFNTTPQKIREINHPIFNTDTLLDDKGRRMSEIYIPGNTGNQISLDIGNDFDTILNAAILKQGIDTTNLKVVDQQVAENFYQQMVGRFTKEIENGGVLLPQVVISDSNNNIAGTIDLLLIKEDGSLEIIDLKTSKDSLDAMTFDTTVKYKGSSFPVKYGSVFYNPYKSHAEQQKFSKEQHHNLQVNSYAQILENQGYDVTTTSTLHVHTPINNYGKKNQKYTQQFKVEGETVHTNQDTGPVNVLVGDPENNDFALPNIVKAELDSSAVDKTYRLNKETGTNEPEIDTAEEEAIAGEQTKATMALHGQTNVLNTFVKRITSQKEAIDTLRNDNKLFTSGEQLAKEIDRTITTIEAGILDNRVQPIFISILKDSIKAIDDFIEYIGDANNYMNDPNYIGKVLNFQNMINTYEGLIQFEGIEGSNKTAQEYIIKLQAKIDKLKGTKPADGEGLINSAIDNFGKQFLMSLSSRALTEEDAQELIKLGTDIGMIEFQTGTMATSSDTILALMDKIFKRKRQEVLDNVEERNEAIRSTTFELEKASGGGVIDYSFMLVLDNKGVPTGRYIQKIGSRYYDERKKAAEGLKDEDGNPREYHKGTKLTDKERKENQELRKAKQKFGVFMKAEKIIDGKIEEGKFHKYSKEFKEARLKYMYFDGHSWNKRANIPFEEWLAFRTKYYRSTVFSVPTMGADGFNGIIKEERQGWFVKDTYVEKKDSFVDENGRTISLLSDKWDKLQNPTNALERSQKNFYDMYVKYFEQDLLGKLPMRVVQQMHGKIPLIKANFNENLKKGPGLLARLWSKAKAAPGAVKDYFLTKKHSTKIVLTDDQGNFVSTLPIMYVGNPKTEEGLQKLTDKINTLNEEFKKPLTETKRAELNQELELLKAKRSRMQNRPEAQEISTDLSDSLMRFSAMAENYEVMSGVEDSLQTMIKILEKRSYNPSDGSKQKTYVDGNLVDAPSKAGEGRKTPRIVERARKWMAMTFYDNDKQTENFFEKVSKGLISYTSLTYVGLNPWGNLNNYVIGRLNNIIETAGGRWFESKAGLRATKEFNRRALPDFFKKMGGKTFVNDILGKSPSRYSKEIYGSKWEALVNLFRMMDQKADIRELNREFSKEGVVDKMWGWGYMLQDAAEYNVQTKVGMAILMSTKVYKSSDVNGHTDAISLYDAYDFDSKTGKVKLKEGYNVMIDFQTGKHKKIDNTARYDLRQYIRETNIHIHGNYAYEDRMVMQTSALGQLAAQFHKWIAPAIKARYRAEYYDENLGWLEGRYRTFYSFMTHVGMKLGNARVASKDWKKMKGDIAQEKSREEIDKSIQNKEAELVKTTSAKKQEELREELQQLRLEKEGKDRVERYMKNIHRTTAEIGLVLVTIILRQIFASMWDDEDEDGRGTVKRFQNALMYQMDRQRSELLQFVSIGDAMKVMKSPISSIRMVEEMGQALMTGVQTPLVLGYDALVPGVDPKLDKRIYYQRGPRKGQLKLSKEVMDTLPLLYALNRWWSYDSVSNYWVK